jgi:hypothetical protein
MEPTGDVLTERAIDDAHAKVISHGHRGIRRVGTKANGTMKLVSQPDIIDVFVPETGKKEIPGLAAQITNGAFLLLKGVPKFKKGEVALRLDGLFASTRKLVPPAHEALEEQMLIEFWLRSIFEAMSI